MYQSRYPGYRPASSRLRALVTCVETIMMSRRAVRSHGRLHWHWAGHQVNLHTADVECAIQSRCQCSTQVADSLHMTNVMLYTGQVSMLNTQRLRILYTVQVSMLYTEASDYLHRANVDTSTQRCLHTGQV